MRSVPQVAVAIMTCLAIVAGTVQAQSVGRVQPILLTASPTCCASPATLVGHAPRGPARTASYMSPMVSPSTVTVSAASQLVPLPAKPTWRGYESGRRTVVAYPPTSVPATSEIVRVTRVVPLAPTVPEGYVVGKGLIGQPKLYKPGQPVRNFLRYLSL